MGIKYGLVFFGKAVLGVACLLSWVVCAAENQGEQPNVVYILADDMGYGDVGCYGQKMISTPNIDQLAAEGMRFTDCYAGSTVCSPSRSVLLTGQHTGHTRVRGNFAFDGGTEGLKKGKPVRRARLAEGDVTIGHVMQRAGYHTGLVGKWHVGGYDPNAGPLDRGFDEFYGWLLNIPSTIGYYPEQRMINRDLVDISENANDNQRLYAEDLCTDEAISFFKQNQKEPFFLYLAYSNPHSPLLVPGWGPYAEKEWSSACKDYAGMVHHLDWNVGRLMTSLEDLGLEKNTVVFFCSDNGPRSGNSDLLTEVVDFFDSNGPLRGYKRDLYEGGIRIPAIVRWPGTTAPGSVCDAPWSFSDVMATLADIGQGELPEHTDSVSVVPLFTGQKPSEDRVLYWEFYEFGFQQAVRRGHWKGLSLKKGVPLELYDLREDIGEQNNVAAEHPHVAAELASLMRAAHVPSPNWPLESE